MQNKVKTAELKVEYACGCKTTLVHLCRTPQLLTDATQSLAALIQMRAEKHLCGKDADLVFTEPEN